MTTFNPKIGHKIARMHVAPTLARLFSKKSPWQYLDDWQNSDRGYNPNELAHINAKMQQMYPGKYKVVKKTSEHGRYTYYDIEFDTPAVETMFRLKYPS